MVGHHRGHTRSNFSGKIERFGKTRVGRNQKGALDGREGNEPQEAFPHREGHLAERKHRDRFASRAVQKRREQRARVGGDEGASICSVRDLEENVGGRASLSGIRGRVIRGRWLHWRSPTFVFPRALRGAFVS